MTADHATLEELEAAATNQILALRMAHAMLANIAANYQYDSWDYSNRLKAIRYNLSVEGVELPPPPPRTAFTLPIGHTAL